MGANALYYFSIFLMSCPAWAIAAILAHYLLRRAAWKHRKRRGRKGLGYYPSAFALGMVFQSIQIFYRPSVEYVLEAKQDEDANADDDGDPETIQKQLNRQLRRIRRGEEVYRLVLRL